MSHPFLKVICLIDVNIQNFNLKAIIMKKGTTLFRKFSRMFAAFLIVPALSFVAVSCSDDDDNTTDPNELKDMPGSVTLAAGEAENTATLKFTANLAWEAAYANEESKWFSFSPASGTAGNATITLSAPYNDGAAKTGKLTIKHGTKTYDVTINQSAGQPDLAQWNPEDLLTYEFLAPDAYNATDEMPIEFTFTVTTKQDYTTLDEAPFKILAFYTDQTQGYAATDSIVDWVEFKIADNSPAAQEGKKIVLTAKPHEEFTPYEGDRGAILYHMNPRNAFITIVPKDTEVKDMFTNGVLKEEYTGKAIEQQTYSLSHSGEMAQLGVGMPQFLTSEFDVTDRNFKEFGIVMYDLAKTEKINWIQATIEGQHVTLSGSSGHMGQSGLLVFTAYRGTELQPLELIHLKPMTVSCMVQ